MNQNEWTGGGGETRYSIRTTYNGLAVFGNGMDWAGTRKGWIGQVRVGIGTDLAGKCRNWDGLGR